MKKQIFLLSGLIFLGQVQLIANAAQVAANLTSEQQAKLQVKTKKTKKVKSAVQSSSQYQQAVASGQLPSSKQSMKNAAQTSSKVTGAKSELSWLKGTLPPTPPLPV